METSTLFISIITGIVGILTTFVNYQVNKLSKKMDAKNDSQKEGFTLILEGLDYIGDLADATAEAVQTGNSDGSMTRARENYATFKRHYSEKSHSCLADIARSGEE